MKKLSIFVRFVNFVVNDYKFKAGRMGIGTPAPAATLDVNGDAMIRGTLNMTGQVISNVSHIDFNVRTRGQPLR